MDGLVYLWYELAGYPVTGWQVMIAWLVVNLVMLVAMLTLARLYPGVVSVVWFSRRAVKNSNRKEASHD